MTYASTSYGSTGYAAESGAPVRVAESIGPLAKFGTPGAIAVVSGLGPLAKFGTPVGELVFYPVVVKARPVPIGPLAKLGQPEMLLPRVAESAGPLAKFGTPAAYVGHNYFDAESMGPLAKFGTPLASMSPDRVATSIGPTAKFGEPSGFTSYRVGSLGPTAKLGQPEGPSTKPISGVFVRDTAQTIFVRN